jgi:hypothetical protein
MGCKDRHNISIHNELAQLFENKSEKQFWRYNMAANSNTNRAIKWIITIHIIARLGKHKIKNYTKKLNLQNN